MLNADGDVLVERIEPVLQTSKRGEIASLDMIAVKPVPWPLVENQVGQRLVGRRAVSIIQRQTAQQPMGNDRRTPRCFPPKLPADAKHSCDRMREELMPRFAFRFADVPETKAAHLLRVGDIDALELSQIPEQADRLRHDARVAYGQEVGRIRALLHGDGAEDQTRIPRSVQIRLTGRNADIVDDPRHRFGDQARPRRGTAQGEKITTPHGINSQ